MAHVGGAVRRLLIPSADVSNLEIECQAIAIGKV